MIKLIRALCKHIRPARRRKQVPRIAGLSRCILAGSPVSDLRLFANGLSLGRLPFGGLLFGGPLGGLLLGRLLFGGLLLGGPLGSPLLGGLLLGSFLFLRHPNGSSE